METTADLPLEDRVMTALERNPYVRRRNLRFEQEALRHVEGVSEISNELEVCWGS